MRAVVRDRYGPPEVLRLEEVERPVPKEDEVLVRIRATTVNRADTHARSGDSVTGRLVSGVRRPRRRILGHELAGEIEAVGPAVTEFAVGDRVFGAVPYLSVPVGTHAEYICLPQSVSIAPIPSNLGFEQAAGILDGALNALNCLRAGDVGPGARILVYGASGSIGTAGVQLARHLGAHVTAVCNTKNVELVRSLGADEVIDYLQEDFTQNGETYDVIFDAVGKHSFRRSKGSLKPGGVYLPTDGLVNLFLWGWTKRFGDKRVAFKVPRFSKKDVLFVKELIESGEYRPVIDRTYPLEDVVEAHRYVETQQKTGNVVLTLDGTRGD